MSLQFSDTSNKKGIVQTIYRRTGADATSYPIADLTADVNIAYDHVLELIFGAGGTWQFDDSGHSDYPIITTNLVAGQRDYAFITDENGNLILDIYKVMVAGSDGIYREIKGVDVQSEQGMDTFFNGQNTQGTPNRYDKTANAIFLDLIPSYSYTDGLKVYINREGSYFTSSDTTKKPGFSGLFHEYLAIRPAYYYALDKQLPQLAGLQIEMLNLEKAIKAHYGKRERDTVRRMRAAVHPTR